MFEQVIPIIFIEICLSFVAHGTVADSFIQIKGIDLGLAYSGFLASLYKQYVVVLFGAMVNRVE
jgi:hypothetical protein